MRVLRSHLQWVHGDCFLFFFTCSEFIVILSPELGKGNFVTWNEFMMTLSPAVKSWQFYLKWVDDDFVTCSEFMIIFYLKWVDSDFFHLQWVHDDFVTCSEFMVIFFTCREYMMIKYSRALKSKKYHKWKVE